jgi:glyoxylase-like metal-dependent hydrolase (beta-lactamase superfamily II)
MLDPTTVVLPPAPRPLLARVLAPPGPPAARLFVHGEDAVLAWPGRYSVSYAIVHGGDVAIADCGSIDDAEPLLAALSTLGLPPGSIRLVIPTHLHFDHMMGVDALAARVGAAVGLGPVAHDHVTAGRPLRFPPGLLGLRAVPTWPMQGLPVFTRADWRGGMDFGFPWSHNRFRSPVRRLEPPSLSGFPGWTLLQTPGHADDGICLHHAASGWLVAGDNLRNFLGGEWNPLTCDRAAYDRTRARLADLPVSLILPGHGPIFEPPPGGLGRLAVRPWYQP